MSTIDWATGVSGLFSAAADWVGAVVPGDTDTAVINATGAYTVTVNSPADVAALTLASANATLAVDSMLSASQINLTAGKLLLDNGASLSGTVTQANAAHVLIEKGAAVTLDDVTWNGVLDPVFQSFRDAGPFVISNGLTLHASNGTGDGTAVFQAVTFNNVSLLDAATITVAGYAAGDIAIVNTPTLTLGSQLTLTGDLVGQEGATVINDGTLTADQAAASGTFVNNGSLAVQQVSRSDLLDSATIDGFGGQSFTNNGQITVSAGAHLILDLAALQAAGAGSAISLQGGVLEIVGSLTTTELKALYSSQHISGGSTLHGFGVLGTLTNTNATLDLGPKTLLGEFDLAATYGARAGGTIYGGTINDEAGGGTLASAAAADKVFAPTVLSHLKLNSSNQTLTLANISLVNVTVSGPGNVALVNNFATDQVFPPGTAMTDSSFSGVSTLSVMGNTVTLDAVSFTGITSGPTINVTGSLALAATQSVAGWTINDLAGNVALSAGGTYSNVTINTVATSEAAARISATSQVGTITFGVGSTLNLASADQTSLYGASGDTFTNQGLIASQSGSLSSELFIGFDQFNNAGTIAAASMTAQAAGDVVRPGAINNAGSIDVVDLNCGSLTNTGTIVARYLTLDGSVSNTGSVAVSNGSIAFGGSLTLGALTAFVASATLTDTTKSLGFGTLDLSGQTVNATTLQSYSLAYEAILDGTLVVNAGHNFSDVFPTSASGAALGVSVVNNGTITASGLDFQGPVTGTGIIKVNDEDSFSNAIGSGQTVQLSSSANSQIVLLNPQTFTNDSLGGTVSGFHVGDAFVISGNTSPLSARFVGDSISVTLNSGGSTDTTLVIATSTALTGSLSVLENSVITYSSTTPDALDWSGGADLDVRHHNPAELAPMSLAGALPWHAMDDIFQFMAHHGLRA